jgi:hypothetical protein
MAGDRYFLAASMQCIAPQGSGHNEISIASFAARIRHATIVSSWQSRDVE